MDAGPRRQFFIALHWLVETGIAVRVLTADEAQKLSAVFPSDFKLPDSPSDLDGRLESISEVRHRLRTEKDQFAGDKFDLS